MHSLYPLNSAKPSHMSELDRDLDSSRFDTEPLQFISREGLTCKDIEDYFTQSINEGKVHEEDDVFSTVSTADAAKKAKLKKMMSGCEHSNGSFYESVGGSKLKQHEKLLEPRFTEAVETAPIPTVSPKKVTISETLSKHGKGVYESFQSFPSIDAEESIVKKESMDTKTAETVTPKVIVADDQTTANDEKVTPAHEKSEDSFDRMARILAKQYMWTSIAVASFVLGIGCIVLSRNVQSNNFHRRYSRR